TGANARQGPHQGAQKSTTVNGWPSIDGANVSLVNSRTEEGWLSATILGSLSAPEQEREHAVVLLVPQQLVAGLLRERLEIAHRGGIGREDAQHLAALHVVEGLLRAQYRQRAVEPARVQLAIDQYRVLHRFRDDSRAPGIQV